MADILNELNEEQKQAVTTTEGYIRVIAGAGSGKTRALTHRFAYLVQELGINTAGVLCVTFTNKAAGEMKKRIRQLIGEKDLGLICTFHGFGVRVLREDFAKVNYPKNFVILDKSDAEEILSNVYKQSGISKQNITFKSALDMISLTKHTEKYVDLLIETGENLYELYQSADSVDKKIFYGYLYEQKKCYGFDFDDLILVTLYVFETYPDVREKWQNRLEYIMVDEFQDVSGSQYALCKMLSYIHKNLFVVGDPDQTIYSWRGAKVEYILNFDKDLPDAKTIFMNKNYRCRPNIVDVSNSLISKNKMRIDKKLEATRTGGNKTVFNHLKNIKEEADWIAKTIIELHESGVEYKDIALFYRSHYYSRQFEEAFIQHKIPYVVHSGIGFYERAEIKTALCYLRMIDSADDLAFMRTINEPKRGFGGKKQEQLKEYADKNKCTLYQALIANANAKPFNGKSIKEYISLIEELKAIKDTTSISDLLKLVLDKSGYEEMLRTQKDEERLENIAELKQSIYDLEKNSVENITLSDYLAGIALFTKNDNETRKNSVSLMTIHAAKGLEFPYVFVCGLNEGIFPSSKTKDIYQMEEERRLCYVAFTRAKEALYISESEGENADNSARYTSRFVFNVDKNLLDYKTELDDEWIKSSKLSIKSKENAFENIALNAGLKVGDTVIHKVLGKGTILDYNEDNTAFIIQFDNLPTLRTISKGTQLLKVSN